MWEDNKFITANLSDYSKKFHIKIEDILNKFSKEEIKRFVNLFFTIIYNAGFVLKSELNKVDLVKIKNILKETSNLSNEDRKLLLEMFKAFIIIVDKITIIINYLIENIKFMINLLAKYVNIC